MYVSLKVHDVFVISAAAIVLFCVFFFSAYQHLFGSKNTSCVSISMAPVRAWLLIRGITAKRAGSSFIMFATNFITHVCGVCVRERC